MIWRYSVYPGTLGAAQTRNVNKSRICRRSLHDICGTHSALDTRRRSLSLRQFIISYNIGCQYFINFTSRHYFVPRTQMWRMRITLFHGGVSTEFLFINLESQLRLAAEGTGNSLSALLDSHPYHVHTHICLCLRTLGVYIMIVNLTFSHCFNVF